MDRAKIRESATSNQRLAMHLTVNGTRHELDVPGHERLLATLRDRLELTGTKLACGRGECGACTVLVDGRAAYACLTLSAACQDRDVITIEGAPSAPALMALQRAFIAHDAAQCGYCTPGQLVAAAALLARTPLPCREDVVAGMSGNLCRCGTYPRIVDAVLDAAGALRTSGEVADDAPADMSRPRHQAAP
jgi:aerobic-type carbon monoxide dehydrogenase small subunit (CoxS/CutS family)